MYCAGPFNSWDRLPFLTDVNPEGGSEGTYVPLYNVIDHNYMIGNYQTQEGKHVMIAM